VGEPRDNTFMFIKMQVRHLAANVEGRKDCLIFAEHGIEFSDDVLENNTVVFYDYPQYEYALFAMEYRDVRMPLPEFFEEEGYYITSDSTVGENCTIYPGCFIGPNVHIGNNALILPGSKIKHATIGDNFLCNENVVVGCNSFTKAKDPNGDLISMPSLGRVVIGNNVELGACDVVELATCGETVIGDNVKLDNLVSIGHESVLHKNVCMAAQATLAGFVDVGENTFIGVGANVKNRINIGKNVTVGMGSVVGRAVKDGETVFGNLAKPIPILKKSFQK
jgi:UDP-3-O-[3-hydroxymyristoyl] glucosamine N-acyltransferase